MATRKRRRTAAGPRIATPLPAPGELETVRAFLDTAPSGDRAEELATAEDLAAWLIDRGLLEAGTELGEKDRRRAIEVRRGLRALVAARDGGAVDGEVLSAVGSAAAAARFRLRVEAGVPVGFEPVSRTLDDAFGALLAPVAAAHRDGLWQRFKICARGDCRRVFFDSSRSNQAKYCTRRCGDRERARAYRRSEKYRRQPKGTMRYPKAPPGWTP